MLPVADLTDSAPVRRRVALLISGLGIVNRGAERFISDLARQLTRWYEVSLLCGGSYIDDLVHVQRVWCLPRGSTTARAIGARHPLLQRVTRRLHLDPNGIEGLTFAMAVLPHLVRSRYDVCITSGGAWVARACRVARALGGTPFVYVGQGIWSEVENARQLPDRHVFCNPESLEIVARRVPGRGRLFIPNGVDITRFAPRAPTRDLNIERPVFLCVGALEPEKAIEHAIHAVAALPRGGLVVVGQGSHREQLVQLGMRLLGDRRFRLEAARFDEMPSYYNACDVFTLPSPHEPFGLVYLEALACNKPVVAPRDRVRELIVGGAGILYDVTSPAEYAHTLAEATATHFGDEPRRQALKFAWSAIAPQYRELVEEVVQGNV